PALLGLPDSGDPLREMRHRSGTGTRPSGEAARGRHLRPAGQSARPPPDLEIRDLPELWRRGAARDRHLRHLLRIVVVFRALLLAARADRVQTLGSRLLDA